MLQTAPMPEETTRISIHVRLTTEEAAKFKKAVEAAQRRQKKRPESGGEVTQSSAVRAAIAMWIAAQGAA